MGLGASMLKIHDLKNQMASFLSGGITLDAFDDWFAQASWNMHLDSEPEVQMLAAKIELLLAEHTSGHLSEPELRSALASALASSPDSLVMELDITIGISVRIRPWVSRGRFGATRQEVFGGDPVPA